MNKTILWIEDDYFAIKGLFRPLQLSGFEIAVATSAVDAYEKAQNWKKYDIIVVDLIIPLSDYDEEVKSETVKGWDNEEYLGVGLAKWLITELKVECPVLLMSVVSDAVSRFKLSEFGLVHILSKKGLRPSVVKAEIFRILGVEE
jgi:CheY-like chemotaxis protein